jgi:nicotinamide phosphoribosyltransferase
MLEAITVSTLNPASEISILTAVDSYKMSHYPQYPERTTRVSSYIEARGGPFKTARFFGLQAILKRYFTAPITLDAVYEAERFLQNHGLPFNLKGWLHIIQAHGGRLPLAIEAVPEGVDVPVGNVLVQVVNTDPECAWLTSYVETLLLQIWYPTTVCTLSAEIRRLLMEQLEESCEDPKAAIPFLLHDFGCRGVSSMESAGLGGLAHLVNFLGTDTVPALLAARRYYAEAMAGFSIPAMEHSTVTAWGRAGEREAFANMLRRFGGPGKTIAMVVDSYDMEHAVDSIIGDELRDAIIESGTKVVVRPDSGDPRVTVPRVLRSLDRSFGAMNNHKGYRVLSPSVRVIQGDGMSLESIRETGMALMTSGFSAENVAYGLGGALLQKVDRDTMRWAMKASAIEIDGVWHDIYKEPKTDLGKRSKRGRLALAQDPETRAFSTVPMGLLRHLSGSWNALRPVYRDGELLVDEDLATIRRRAVA